MHRAVGHSDDGVSFRVARFPSTLSFALLGKLEDTSWGCRIVVASPDDYLPDPSAVRRRNGRLCVGNCACLCRDPWDSIRSAGTEQLPRSYDPILQPLCQASTQ